jgi:hypothetical protein
MKSLKIPAALQENVTAQLSTQCVDYCLILVGFGQPDHVTEVFSQKTPDVRIREIQSDLPALQFLCRVLFFETRPQA